MTEIATRHCQNEESPQASCLTAMGKPSCPGQGQKNRAARELREEGIGLVKEAQGYGSWEERVFFFFITITLYIQKQSKGFLD